MHHFYLGKRLRHFVGTDSHYPKTIFAWHERQQMSALEEQIFAWEFDVELYAETVVNHILGVMLTFLYSVRRNMNMAEVYS